MDGGGGGGGAAGGSGRSGTTPTNLAAAMRHMLPVDEDDYACSIELAVPEVAAAGAGSEASDERPAKRAKQDRPGPAAAPAITKCRASSVALKQHSEVFRQATRRCYAPNTYIDGPALLRIQAGSWFEGPFLLPATPTQGLDQGLGGRAGAAGADIANCV